MVRSEITKPFFLANVVLKRGPYPYHKLTTIVIILPATKNWDGKKLCFFSFSGPYVSFQRWIVKKYLRMYCISNQQNRSNHAFLATKTEIAGATAVNLCRKTWPHLYLVVVLQYDVLTEALAPQKCKESDVTLLRWQWSLVSPNSNRVKMISWS